MIVVVIFSVCSALESLHCVRSAHKLYWSCLKHAGVIYPLFFCTIFTRFNRSPLSVAHFFVFYFIHYFWLSAGLPTSEISSKLKSAEETKAEAEKETVKEEKVWPEPQKRVSPPVRAALILPDNVACPGGCQRFSSTEDLDPATISKLRYEVLTPHGYSFIIQHIVYWFNKSRPTAFPIK